MAEPFAYDSVEYPSAALPQAHPGHLYAVARMFGLEPAPADHCRTLELGCGDGTHLVAAAVALPDAEFVGVDLSAAAVERGNRVIAELGLPNVSLYAADLTAWEPPAGGFDYVVAHGLYSWLPVPVRDALLSLMSRSLRPGGVGYVSYNTYPGCYIRRMVWEILRYHTEATPDPAGQIREARQLLRFLAAGQQAGRGPGPALFAHEIDGLLNDHDPRVLYHDDLGAVNDPVYFHEFVAHAGRFGLRFVAEAEPSAMESRAFPAEVAGVLDGLGDRDPVVREQYLDFLRLRRFRQTLLATDGGSPRKTPDAAAVPGLAVSGRPKPAAEPVDLAPGIESSFAGERGASARTDLPIAKAAFLELAARWPGRLPFDELLARSAARLGRAADADDAEALTSLIAAVWMTGLVSLHGDRPRYAETVSERPVASPLARLQARSGTHVSTLLHDTKRLDDEPTRLLVQLLDGTRTREQLAAELLAAFPPDKRPDPAALREGLDRNLARLAKGALLVG
jgi:SAM-dependent methyltransferase